MTAKTLRWTILTVCGLYFVGPLLVTFLFTIQDKAKHRTDLSAYSAIFQHVNGQESVSTALWLSLQLALLTIVLTLALLLPTMLLIHLRFPGIRPLVEVLSLLPLVFPPVVLVVGVSDTFTWTSNNLHGPLNDLLTNLRDPNRPLILAFLYVMLSMPFTFRALDAGIRAIDVKTLVEASRNLGSGWVTVLFRVLAPSLRTSLVNASFLCFALVMGEYTISSILLYKPFPVWLAELPTTSGRVQAAASLLSLLIVEVLLLLVGAVNWRTESRRSRA